MNIIYISVPIIAIMPPCFQEIKTNHTKELSSNIIIHWKGKNIITVWSKHQVKGTTKHLKFTLHFLKFILFHYSGEVTKSESQIFRILYIKNSIIKLHQVEILKTTLSKFMNKNVIIITNIHNSKCIQWIAERAINT